MKFVFYLSLLHECLSPVPKLSLALQRDSVDFLMALSLLESFYDSMNKMKQEICHTSTEETTTSAGFCTVSLVMEAKKKPVIDFRGTDIRTELAVVNCFENSFESYINSITDCVRVRFGDTYRVNLLF